MMTPFSVGCKKAQRSLIFANMHKAKEQSNFR